MSNGREREGGRDVLDLVGTVLSVDYSPDYVVHGVFVFECLLVGVARSGERARSQLSLSQSERGPSSRRKRTFNVHAEKMLQKGNAVFYSNCKLTRLLFCSYTGSQTTFRALRFVRSFHLATGHNCKGSPTAPSQKFASTRSFSSVKSHSAPGARSSTYSATPSLRLRSSVRPTGSATALYSVVFFSRVRKCRVIFIQVGPASDASSVSPALTTETKRLRRRRGYGELMEEWGTELG